MKEDKDFKKRLGAVSVEVVQSDKSSPSQIVSFAKKKAEEKLKDNIPYDIIWVVFDHDNYPDRKKAYDIAIKEKFKIAFSAICFEEWYLLHFTKSAKNFNDCSALISDLKKYYKDYEKAKKNDYQELKSKIETAKANAVWLRKKVDEIQSERHITDKNPWTEIDVLIKDLIENP